MKFSKGAALTRKANSLIPGGAHTYSKGFDQFPQNAPGFIVKGNAARVTDVDGNEFIDWGMGLRSVCLGHAHPKVLDAVHGQLEHGVNFTRPNPIESKVAEKLTQLIPCAEMVKFSKNGSDVTTAAVKLARAYTQKEMVLRCKDHPFFSVDDWFIGNTFVNNGIPQSTKELTKNFNYNDIESVENLVNQYKNKVACIILEPAATQEPKDNFLEKIREICNEEGIVLIFDEIITGFRWHPKGAQHYYGVTPDLATFGKAIANGFSTAALVGKKDIMQLGGLLHKERKVFLLSSTYGAETHALAAAYATIEILEDGKQISKNWETGKKFKNEFNKLMGVFSASDRIKMKGPDISPYIECVNQNGNVDLTLKTLFLQETIKQGLLIPYISICASHDDNILAETIGMIEAAMPCISTCIKNNTIEQNLIGPAIKPVFREYN